MGKLRMASACMLLRRIALISVAAALVLTEASFADVSVSVGADAKSFTLTNTTPTAYRLGGARFYDHSNDWTSASAVYGMAAGWIMAPQTVGGRHEQNCYYNSTAPAWGTKLAPGAALPVTNGDSWTDSPYQDCYVLLRTGAPGVPDDPIDPGALTLTQLDSVMAVPDFYSATYKYDYYDSLGVNGGIYSGGFLDTWHNERVTGGKDETQIQFAIPGAGFTVSGTSVNFQPTGMDYYWMSLAMAQEYFRVDMQWMAAQGAKETFIGTTEAPLPTNQNGVYGFWQVENTTGADRALSYPTYFPKYSLALATAADVTTLMASTNIDDMLSYYCRGTAGLTPVNSALILNACVLSILTQYLNYDMCSYCTDMCWKEALANEKDPYMGVGCMTCIYNIGDYTELPLAVGLFHPANYIASSNTAAPGGRYLLGTGNSNYVSDIIDVAQAEIDASRQYETQGSNLQLVDFQITERELQDMFFGDNGTVATQGNGGLMLHYYDPAAGNFTATRQQVWNTLDAAFNKLKGHAPTASATTISYRYDFLAVLRTVKATFPFVRQEPVAGDASSLIPQNSTGAFGSCSGGGASDEVYPYIFVSNPVTTDSNFTIFDTTTDNAAVKDVKWTLDSSWTSSWNEANYVSGAVTNKIFKFTATKAQVLLYRDTLQTGGHSVWIMVTDSSGNSTITKKPVPVFKSSPVLTAASAIDTNGDGIADIIHVFENAGSNPSLKGYTSLVFSYTTNPQTLDSTRAVNNTVNMMTVNPTMALTTGTGQGTITITYDTSVTQFPLTGTILDSVGPVLRSATLLEGTDTLILEFSETLTGPVTGTFIRDITKSNDASNTAMVAGSGTYAGKYIVILPATTPIAGGDSINLIPSGGIKDAVGNIPAVNNQV